MRARLTGRELSIAWLLVVAALGWTAMQRTSALAWMACGISILLPALVGMVAANTPSRSYRSPIAARAVGDVIVKHGSVE